MYLGIYKDSFS